MMGRGGLASVILAGGMAVHAAGVAGAAFASGATGERRGLSTGFVEVLLEGVPIASRYVLEMKPYDFTNKSDFTMKIRVDAILPGPDEVRGGFEPIPDPAWVSFEPRELTLPPGGRGSVRVVLYTPDDPALTGKKYVVSLWARGIPIESPSVGVGLRPRLYFTLAGKDRPGMVVKLDTNPKFPRLMPFEIASSEAVMRFSCGAFNTQNQFGEEVVYELTVDRAAAGRVGASSAQVIPDASWVHLHPSTLVLAPWAQGDVQVSVEMPFQAGHFGRAYVIPIRATARRRGAPPVDVFNRVSVVVPDPLKQARGGAD